MEINDAERVFADFCNFAHAWRQCSPFLGNAGQNFGQHAGRVKANQFIADLHKKRDEFQESVKKRADAGEAAWLGAKSQMEDTWNGFETEVKKYVETFGKQLEQ